MNIGFVSDSYPLGGLANVVVKIGHSLESYGHSSFYYATSGDKSNFYNIPNEKLFVSTTIKKNSYIRNFIRKTKIFLFLSHSNKVDLGNFLKNDLIGIKNFIIKNEIECLVICRYDTSFLVERIKKIFPQLKVIIWIHGPVELYTEKKERAKYLYYYKTNLKVADSVVCLTATDLSKLRKFGIQGNVIYNPLLIDSKNSNLNKENIVLSVTRLDIFDKGIDVLIELADKLPESWKLVLIGDGSKKERQILNNLIGNMKNPNKISFLGSKKPDQIGDFYEKAKIFASPSKYEGFGLTLIEAMSFYVPIVTFATTGAKEITQDGEYGVLVNDFSKDQFQNQVINLIKNPEEIAKLSILSKNRSQSFKLESIIKDWIILINNLD